MADLHDALAHVRAGRWNEAHSLAQADGAQLGDWLHGILHIQENDLKNAEYWYHQAHRNFQSRGTLEEELERFEAALAL